MSNKMVSKVGDTQTIHLRVTRYMHDAVKLQSQKENITISEYIRQAISEKLPESAKVLKW